MIARSFSLNRFRNVASVDTPNGNGPYSFMPKVLQVCVLADVFHQPLIAESVALPMPSAPGERDDHC